MSKRASEKNIGETKNKKFKKELTIDDAKTEIVNKIIDEIKDLLHDQTQGDDSTDGATTLFEDIFQPILDEFKELIGESKDKKNFIGGLIKMFTILLSTTAPTLTKKNQYKCKNFPGSRARTKATVRRLSRSTFVASLNQRIGNKNIMNRR